MRTFIFVILGLLMCSVAFASNTSPPPEAQTQEDVLMIVQADVEFNAFMLTLEQPPALDALRTEQDYSSLAAAPYRHLNESRLTANTTDFTDYKYVLNRQNQRHPMNRLE